MKYIWKENDIILSEFVNCNSASEIWMIGYGNSLDKGKIYYLISQNDGLVIPFDSKIDLANHLTQCNAVYTGGK